MPEPNSASGDKSPVDPLLGFDAFISASDNNDWGTQNGEVNATDQQPNQSEPSQSTKEEQKKPPATETTATPPSRRGRKGLDDGERPDWLPDGWQMISKTRTSGATAGSTDRYYYDPTSNPPIRFRSKNEVLHFLETGSKLKRKLTVEGNAKNSPGGQKEKKKSGSKSTKPKTAAWSFDFKNPPEEVIWSLSDVSQGVWKPSIGDQQVPESSRQEWTTTFERICEM